MASVFGKEYADAYDALYRDKDYDGEVALLQKVFKLYGRGDVRRVLDLGCGTGNHSLRLARLGYEVTGVDRSDEMLAKAEAKARAQNVSATWVRSNIVDFQSAARFDAALLMFAVLGYHISNEEVLGALATARSHLVDGGLLIFDVWYGPAVLAQRPGERVRVMETAAGTTIRATAGALDSRTHTCRVDYRLWELKGDRLAANVSETHLMRYFFPRELEMALQIAGFEMKRMGVFPDIEHEPDETTWNVMVVAGVRQGH